MSAVSMMSNEEAVRTLRADPRQADLVRDAYLGRDVRASADRFRHSSEWAATERLLESRIPGAVVIDLGAGTGIVAAAFGAAGARRVIAVEPDPSDEIGRGAIARIGSGPTVEIVDALGEHLPFDDQSVDIVYARQLLHHASDLPALVGECARVLRPGGAFLAVREHVVDDERQLARFLANHPVHQLAGGENAYSLEAYLSAIQGSGLVMQQLIGPWDSVINAFPFARTEAELTQFPRHAVSRRLGRPGDWLLAVPGVMPLLRWYVNRPTAGRRYAFFATKPEAPDP
jgi:SAM-dependent methyltransferase